MRVSRVVPGLTSLLARDDSAPYGLRTDLGAFDRAFTTAESAMVALYKSHETAEQAAYFAGKGSLWSFSQALMPSRRPNVNMASGLSASWCFTAR